MDIGRNGGYGLVLINIDEMLNNFRLARSGISTKHFGPLRYRLGHIILTGSWVNQLLFDW